MELSNNLNNGLFCSVDWISFTLDVNIALYDALNMFGFSHADFTVMPRGASGYRKMLQLNGSTVRVLYDGNADMGVHFDVTGSGMNDFCQIFNDSCYNIETPWDTMAIDMQLDVVRELFATVLMNGHFSRLDLAIDNKRDIFYTVSELNDVLRSGNFLSRWRNWKYIEDFNSGVCCGRTVYLGSRTSNILLRVYDKQLEQNKKHPAGDPGHVADPWVRWELELHNERADIAAKYFLEDMKIGDVAVGVLANYLRVIVPDNEVKCRCSSAPKWEAFINGILSLKLFVSAPLHNLAEKKEWLVRQCAPTIAAIIMADHGDFSFISECIDMHAARMKKYLRDLVSECNPDWETELETRLAS